MYVGGEYEPMADPVLIVGAGPTGLTAALELSRMGIAVRLVDKAAGPATTSRAIGVQARTLELFRQRGLDDEMVRLGNRGRWGSIYGGGERVFRLDFSLIDSPFPFMLFISQAETERILREACARHGVAPEWRTELVAFRQEPHAHAASPVTAVLRRPDGSLEELSSPWVISAEGAHSTVRTTLDVPYEGHTRTEEYVLGDVRIDGEVVDTDFHIFSSEHGFMGLFPMGGDHFRLIASYTQGDARQDQPPSLALIQQIYDQRSPILARFHDCVWSSWFRINSRMVPRVRVGRMFLGGDSAHIHSPAGAQGMNTGIQDMINLCWKLALVMKGKAPVALLDTYEKDRLPIMRGVLAGTDQLTNLIGTENHYVRAVFNHIAPMIGGATMVQKKQAAGMSQIALGYRGSPLSEPHHHGGALQAGDRVPALSVNVRSKDGWATTSTLSALDTTGFTLLVAVTNPQDDIDPVLESPAWTLVEIRPTDTAAPHFRELFGSDTVLLVRPDGYVGLTSSRREAAARLQRYREKWLTPEPAASH